MVRAAAFAFVGVLFLSVWLAFDPGHEVAAAPSQWHVVLGFSAAILALALALPALARVVGGRAVFRISLVPASGAALGSLANVLEDGLQLGWAFFGFVAGAVIVELGLIALTVAIAVLGRGAHRLLAVVPVTSMAAIVLYVAAGGILMLVSWLTAAALALALPRHAPPA